MVILKWLDYRFAVRIALFIAIVLVVRQVIELSGYAIQKIEFSVIGALSFIWVIQYGQAISKAYREISDSEKWIASVVAKSESLAQQALILVPKSKIRFDKLVEKYLKVLRETLLNNEKLTQLKVANSDMLVAIGKLETSDAIKSRLAQYHYQISTDELQLVQQDRLLLPGRTYFFLYSTALLILTLLLVQENSVTNTLALVGYAFAFSSAMILLRDADDPFEHNNGNVSQIGVDLSIIDKLR